MAHSALTSKVVHIASTRRASKKKILLVDDDGTVLRSLRRFLTVHYHVETAANAEMAAVRLAEGDFEAIVTDFDMPIYNGIWLLGQVAAKYPQMNRVMISANDPALFAPHIQSGLIQHYHIKPISFEGIVESIEN
ncbi:MAG: response regulator [Deltaproteobacteria bacterium]|nr:response regulator [Deltaproteobacteria bacterium]MBN2671743.1 response regulator [Deltaproteobacteria bacterium]